MGSWADGRHERRLAKGDDEDDDDDMYVIYFWMETVKPEMQQHAYTSSRLRRCVLRLEADSSTLCSSSYGELLWSVMKFRISAAKNECFVRPSSAWGGPRQHKKIPTP